MEIKQLVLPPLENNAWLLMDEQSAIVIDAPSEAEQIMRAAAGRQITAIVITHGHFDHVGAAEELRRLTGAPVYLHPDDRKIAGQKTDSASWRELHDSQTLTIGGQAVEVLHTPGHTPGSSCVYLPASSAVFTGDTLFPGGPGATGNAHSNFKTIIASIRSKLFTLPEGTKVHPGHGQSTTIGDESPHLQEWIDRGW